MKPIEYLKKLESSGYEAYIVGGYTRDYLLGNHSYDVDITTSATPDEVRSVFEIDTKDNYGSISIKDGDFSIDITTYRLERSYDKRKPGVVEYTKDIREDLYRRDFTINAICMDSKYSIFDPYDGRKDLNDGIIRSIGRIDEKMDEDPLRMLRALRFSILYDFKIEESLYSYIQSHLNKIANLSYERKRREIESIWENCGPDGLYRLGEMIPLSILDISINRKLKNGNITSLWAQIDYGESYNFNREFTASIKKEREKMN